MRRLRSVTEKLEAGSPVKCCEFAFIHVLPLVWPETPQAAPFHASGMGDAVSTSMVRKLEMLRCLSCLRTISPITMPMTRQTQLRDD